MASSADFVRITIKWSGKEYMIDNINPEQTILQLKESILDKTGVLPARQKLLGLKFKGKPPDNEVKIKDLNLKANTKIMMMGTREENLADIIKPSEELLNNEVVNDFDIEEDDVLLEKREENLMKIAKRVSDYKINVLNNPDETKKLLVLDVDYTLFDHRSVAENGFELMRPYLHEFLKSAYEDYNIVIWSATSMKWIEAKMKEMSLVNHPEFKMCFYLDCGAMITVKAPKYGIIETKPLGVIWGKYPCFSNKNTIMFDDLRRNFLMNPQNGLKIRPFREAHFNRDKDKELLKLKKYLKEIAKLEDLSHLNHRHWERHSS